ncbi:MAG: GDSL-type esterase/lipase family protein [Candidatus Limnocylindria bacterium]
MKVLLMLVAALLASACAPDGRPAEATPTEREAARPSPGGTTTPSPTPAPIPTPSPAPTTAPAAAPLRYVAIGASDTVGVGAADPAAGSWPALLATRMPEGSTYLNLGVSGSLAGQARTEQLPAALAAEPTLVTVWLAVNDLNAGFTPAAYATALASVVDPLVGGTDARIFIGNVPDLRAVPVYAEVAPSLLLAWVVAFNDAVEQVAAKHPGRVFVVDLFAGSAELTNAITVADDGFHPSDSGYGLIADRFAETIAAQGIALGS